MKVTDVTDEDKTTDQEVASLLEQLEVCQTMMGTIPEEERSTHAFKPIQII